MVDPQIRRVKTDTVGTKIMKGMERNKLIILSKIQKTTLFSKIPPLRVTTTITPKKIPMTAEIKPLTINIYKVSIMALGNSSAYITALGNKLATFHHLYFHASITEEL